MKKLIVALVAIIVALGVGRQLLLPLLAPGIFQRTVSSTVGVDQTANLPDGLHIYICGAGSPLPDPKRSGACIGVLAGRKAFVIDVGSASVSNLARMGFPMGRIEQFYLTHLHSDHFDGLGEALLNTWVTSGRITPIKISGPRGTSEVVEGFNTAYRQDGAFRTAHHGTDIADPAGFGGQGQDIPLTEGIAVIHEEGSLKITAAIVSHAPVEPAFGYRIDYKDRSVFISGDTAYNTDIALYAEDVDVLFHEALNRDMVRQMEEAARKNGAGRLAKIFADIPDYHASPVEAAKIAQAARARHLVIYHPVPPLPVDALQPLWAKGMDKAYDGKITISEDGTIVRLPAGGRRIIYDYGL